MEWNIFKRNREKRDAGDAILTTPTGTGLNFGSLFNQQNAIGLSTVFRCINLISDSIAVMPIGVYTMDGGKVPHQLKYILNNNKNYVTKFEFIKLLVDSILIKGNGFAYIERNGDGSAKSLRYIESSDVTIHYTKSTNDLYYTCNLVSNKKIEPCNMIHLKMFSYDGVNGISILSVGSRALRLANSTENSALNYFDSGMNISGVLSVASSLTPQQIKDIKQAWNDTYVSGNGGIAVLQGNMTYSPVSSNANEAQLLENRNYAVIDICRWFGINPLLMGIGTTYGDVEQAQNEFVLHTLLPYVENIEEEFTRKLLKPSEQQSLEVVLDENYLLRMSKINEANYYTTLTNAGVLSVNEVREKLGFIKVDGGDDLRIPYSDANQNNINNQSDEQRN